MKNQRHFAKGVLVKEVRDGIEITSNLGKTPLQISAALSIARKSDKPNVQPRSDHPIIVRHIIPPVQVVPYSEWPLWAKALAMLAKPEDKGIGDVVARTVGAENSEAFKKWFKATTGKDCGCTGRHRRLNIEYPLP